MVTPAEVRRVAELARLRLDDGEAEALARDLGGILEHVEALGPEMAADGTGPSRGGVESLRRDEPGPDPLVRPLDHVAPAMADGFLVVPRLASHPGPGEGVSGESE